MVQPVGLLVMGLVAAACVALLVASLRADTGSSARESRSLPSEVEIYVAATDLAEMTVVEQESFELKTVSRVEMPSGAYTNPVNFLGQVLAMPIVKGQPFTSSVIVAEGPGKHIAGTLAKGMRAVSVSLPHHSAMDGILYPGAVVDVLVSLKLPLADRKGEVMSSTLFQSIQVVGIGDLTVASSEEDDRLKARNVDRRRNRIITLRVNAEQAVVLQLAREHGTVSLALRSPLDSDRVESSGILLSEFSEYLGWLAKAVNRETAPHEEETAPSAPARPTYWNVDIFRGSKMDARSVPMPRG